VVTFEPIRKTNICRRLIFIKISSL